MKLLLWSFFSNLMFGDFQDELMKSEREVSSMQMKLKNARQLLDVEKNRTTQISKEKYELVCGLIDLNTNVFT